MRWPQALIRNPSLQRLLHGEGPLPSPVTLHRRRIYILPTRQGLLYALTLLLLLLGAINYASSLVFALTFLLVGLGWVAMHHTHRNLAGLQLVAGRVEPVFAGEYARFGIQAASPDGPARSALRLQAAGTSHGEVAIDADGDAALHLELPTVRRGLHPLGAVTIETRFPLGLFRAWSKIDLGLCCTVYPRPAPPDSAPPPAAASAAAGPRHRAGDEEFDGFRDYRPGDPPRDIYWKGLARSDVLLTRRHEDSARETRWLDWAQTAGDTEARLSRLCRWALASEQAGHRYGLRMPDGEIAPGRGADQLHRCLARLALYGQPMESEA